jgi:PAS domain S-box-containing protein
LTPASQKIFKERFPVLLKEGRNRAEVEFVYKNGTIVTMDCSGSAVHDEQGEIASFMVVERDITERKRAEKELRRAEEKYRTMIEHSNDLIWTLDTEGKFTYANKQAEELSGYGQADLIGKNFDPLLPPGDVQRISEVYYALLNGKPQQYEVSVIRKDGSVFVLSVNSAPLYDSGKIVGVVNFARNITEQKLAERALQEGEQRYRKLVESVTDYMYTVQVENGRAKETKHGPGCVAVTGYTSEEYDADPYMWYRMIHEEDRRSAAEQNEKILSGAAPQSLEHRIIHKDGSVRWVKNTPVPRCDDTGRLIAYDGMVTDITERKKLENQLHQAQKMEAVGQLAGGIAHDFNNILSAILGYGSLLQMKIEENDPLRSYVDQIIASSHRAAHLTHSILAFSRKQIINLMPVDLNEIIGRVEKLLVRIIGEDIELKTGMNGDVLLITADTGQIEQVLINLCTNARDAMPQGGFLMIETRLMECDELFVKAHPYAKPGTYAMVSVSDTGIGMDDGTKEKIFEPFFTTKEVGRGTGLGLSIVYGIIKQHGGYINVYSESGKGTTFKLYFPILESGIKETESMPSIPAARGAETVLMAEDDAAVRTIARKVFEQFGYTVIEARDGEDAVKKFLENKDNVHLVVLDLLMPKKNGKEAYEEIRKIRPDVKVIFTSGYTADILNKKGILEEGINFLSKPISTNDLIRKVREVLDTETSKP